MGLLVLISMAILDIDQAEFYRPRACSLIMLHVKFEIHGGSGFREKAFKNGLESLG